MGRETIDEISTEEWQLTFDTNVLAMFHLCKLSIPFMLKGSSIINTTSVNAYQPNPTLLPYAATKAAIQNYTANLNQMLIEQKKRHTCKCGGSGSGLDSFNSEYHY